MLLSNMKIRSRHLDHPLGEMNFIKGFTQDQIEEFVGKIKSGTLSKIEREDLITSYIFLALQVAGRYANLKPWIADDLVSAGLQGIVYAINKAAEKLTDSNLSAWITANIHRFITQTFLNDDMIAVKSSKLRHEMKLLGITPKPLVRVSIEETKSTLETTAKDIDILEMKEEILLASKDSVDKFIIEMKMKGFKDVEIAEFLQMSQSCVAKRRVKIQSRYTKMKNEP